MIISLSTFDWHALSTIATFFAVLTALFYPMWRERKHIKIHAAIGQIINDPDAKANISFITYEKTKYRQFDTELYPLSVVITVTNVGKSSITITGWEWIIVQKDGTKDLFFGPTINLPCKLLGGDYLQLYSPHLVDDIHKIRRIDVIDSHGKRWKIKSKYIKNSQKSI